MTSLRPWLYLVPAVAVMSAWIFLPLAGAAGLSLMDWNLTGRDRPFVGLDNYRDLAAAPELANALRNTALYALGLAPLAIVLPMCAAILLWKHTGALAPLYRVLVFLPVMVAPVVAALVWQWILHPLDGLANAALAAVGAGPVNWLGSSRTALGSVVLITAWKVFGLSFVLYSAGLANIDRRYVEAARTDGAREWDVTRRVLVPLLAPTTVVVSFLCLVLAGQWSFATVAVLTQGGPAGSTDNLFYLLYNFAFRYFDVGSASALAVIILALFAGLAFAQSRLSARLAFHDR